jgi:hypothetical protein
LAVHDLRMAQFFLVKLCVILCPFICPDIEYFIRVPEFS